MDSVPAPRRRQMVIRKHMGSGINIYIHIYIHILFIYNTQEVLGGVGSYLVHLPKPK